MEEGDPRGGVLAVQLRPLRVQALHDEVEGLQNGQDKHYFLLSSLVVVLKTLLGTKKGSWDTGKANYRVIV